MSRWIHSIALSAAVLTLLAGLWQDWGTFSVLKRGAIAYLGFFFLGAALTLAVRAGALWDGSRAGESGGDQARD